MSSSMDDHPRCRLPQTAKCVVFSLHLTMPLSPVDSHPLLQDGPLHRLYGQRASSPPGQPSSPLGRPSSPPGQLSLPPGQPSLPPGLPFYTSQRTTFLAPPQMLHTLLIYLGLIFPCKDAGLFRRRRRRRILVFLWARLQRCWWL
ncbi:hypothetical protein Pcinc_037907 [Petrolisthes cinctipes]|uniref:Uncharacterized protein n=1 Tax=Petrolisthes cinctipes TaxID=88211 RepID=A0AAE1BRP9_PETCI|nr:hypothetical protein Pcinc_037907 [Petrolisthes cinctipes]